MAKNKVEIDVLVDDKGTTGKVGLGAKKAGDGLDAMAKGARNADRNTKGAAQASANGTKNFSKMAQGMGGLVGAYATFAASVFALSAAFNFLKNAADIQLLEQSQTQFAQNSGIAMQSLTGKLREASKGMLDFQTAASASAMGLAKGFSSEQMTKMAEGALKVSNVLGRDFNDAFNRLTKGVSKAEPELLDELGITLRLEDAKKKYAESLGISADALSTADASQAVYLETMRQLNNVVGEAEGQANPFIQLGTTFSDLAKTVANFLLPPFTALANFLNENAGVAALFFGAIGLGIAKNMPFVGEAKEGIIDFFESQVQKSKEAKSALEKYGAEIEETKKAASELRAEGAKELKSGAGKAVKAGAKSPILARAAAGEMRGPDKSNLKKALRAAEAEYKKSGKITKGIFKDVGIDIAREIGAGLKKTETKARKTSGIFKNFFKRQSLRAKATGAAIKKYIAGGLVAASKAAKVFGKAMNMAMKATVVLGIIQLIYDLVITIISAPRTILDGIISVIKGTLKFIEVLVNVAIEGINYVIDQANKIPGIDMDRIESADFAADAGKAVEEYIKNVEILGTKVYEVADSYQKGNEAADSYRETLNGVKDTATELAKELDKITAGKVFDTKDKDYNPLKADRASAETVKSLPVLDMMRELDTLKKKDPEKYAKGLEDIKEKMVGLAKISPKFSEAVNEGNTEAVARMTTNAGRFTKNVDEALDQLQNMSSALKGKNADAVLIYVSNISKMGNAAVTAGKDLELTTDVLDKLDARFKDSGGIDAFIENLRKIEAEDKRIKGAKSGYDIAKIDAGANLNAQFGARAQTRIAAKMAELELDQKRNDLQRLHSERKLLDDAFAIAAHEKVVEQAEREIELAKAKSRAATKAADDMAQMGLKIGDSLQSNMQTAFQSLVDGTKSAKQAFADMAKSIIADIAKMIIKMMVFKLLTSALGGTAFGDFLGIGGAASSTASTASTASKGMSGGGWARNGGIFSEGKKVQGYSTGGVAKGSTSGYPAVLHGTEAVVPLPNGKAIPVEMKDSGATNNNIVVNVSTDGQTSKTDSSGPDMDKLGGAIAQAVQAELQNQKRSGGILNPYGAA